MTMYLFLLCFIIVTKIWTVESLDSKFSKSYNTDNNIFQTYSKSMEEIIQNGTFGVPIEDNVSATDAITYVFKYDFYYQQQWAIYICVTSVTATSSSPLLVVVRQSLSIMSWNVPLRLSSDGYKHTKVCHTLCPLSNYLDSRPKEGPQKVYVELSTSRKEHLPFELLVKNLTNFLIGTNQKISLNMTPAEPQVLEYHMPDDVSSVLVEATSVNDKCMILAVQDIQCPFYDSARSVEYKGFYQTMTVQSGITVTRKFFKSGKVYLVMILKATNDECTGHSHHIDDDEYIYKSVHVNIAPSISDDDFYRAVFGAFGVFLLLYLSSFIVCLFLFVRKRRMTASGPELQNVAANLTIENPQVQSYGTVSDISEESTVSDHTVGVYDIHTNAQRQGQASNDLQRQVSIPVDETDFDRLPDAERDKNVIRTKTVLYVVDLARKNEKYLSKRTKVYSWNLLTVAVFYGLPVVQLVYINQKIVNLTGNQDICYYNFLCSHKLWVFSDFNHVYSNVGYVMLGLLFLLLVWRREVIEATYSSDETNESLGIPHHFGLFYAMGFALIMEGILSASYHVCPNKANFQFDTAFMYVIATVCMLKLYQARHPDITAKSHHTWMILAAVLLIGVAGVLQGGTLFWIVFIIGHVITTVLVSITIYYMGRWKLDRWLLKRAWQNIKLDIAAGSFRPTYLGRFMALVIAVLINFSLDLFGVIKRPPNFAAYLLAVFIVNLLLYLLYYTGMKVFYKERIRWIPLMYMVLSFVCWAAALHFFLLKNTSWQMTPALSRERNKHCVLLNFYDDHDIWHFLSSCALFFSYMVLFTLDDDLVNTPRTQIIVF